MKIYPLAPLLPIFAMRRDRAERQALEAYKQVLKAKALLKKAKNLFDDYKVKWPLEEAKLFNRMLGKLVDRKKMAQFKQQEKVFRLKEAMLLEKSLEHEKSKDIAEKKRQEAQYTLKKAAGKLEKFQKQKLQWDQAQHLEEERLLEKEMEELTFTRQDKWAHLFLKSETP